MPRQARDKHRKKLRKKLCFLQELEGSLDAVERLVEQGVKVAFGAKNAF